MVDFTLPKGYYPFTEPDRKPVPYMGRFGPYTFAEVGDKAVFDIRPEVITRINQLIVPRLGYLFEIEDLLIGNCTQFVQRGPYPGYLFREKSELSKALIGNTCNIGQQITLIVRYAKTLKQDFQPVLQRLKLCFQCGAPTKKGHSKDHCFYCGTEKEKQEPNISKIFKKVTFDAFVKGTSLV